MIRSTPVLVRKESADAGELTRSSKASSVPTLSALQGCARSTHRLAGTKKSKKVLQKLVVIHHAC